MHAEFPVKREMNPAITNLSLNQMDCYFLWIATQEALGFGGYSHSALWCWHRCQRSRTSPAHPCSCLGQAHQCQDLGAQGKGSVPVFKISFSQT